MNYAALMHDIGKIGIPDAILLKPGKLTKQEFEYGKHTNILGQGYLKDSKRNVIKMGYELALTTMGNGMVVIHQALRVKLPLTARVVAIADVFDALSTEVQKAFPIETCLEILKAERNKHFDGELVDLFLENIHEIIKCKNTIDLKFLVMKMKMCLSYCSIIL